MLAVQRALTWQRYRCAAQKSPFGLRPDSRQQPMHFFSSTRHTYVDLEAAQDGVAAEVRRANGRKQHACCIDLRV